MNTPLVSIITPAYNCANKLLDTIQTIKHQTYANWELLIVDDCSTDNTLEIANACAKQDQRIRVFTQELNGGASLARNKAINEARGKYIAFLDGDDMWLPNKLECQILYMEDKDYLFTYSPYYILEDNASTSSMPIRNCPDRLTYRTLLKWNRIGCLTVIINIEVLGKINIPRLDKRNDYALWLKYLRGGTTAHRYNKPLAIYRSHQGISKGNKFSFIRYHFEMFNNVLCYSKITSLWYTCRNLFYYYIYKTSDISYR